jgi:splicing factor U2AF subunit
MVCALGASLTDLQQQQLFDDFYEDLFVEMSDKYGPVEELHVCDNLGEHLICGLVISI